MTQAPKLHHQDDKNYASGRDVFFGASILFGEIAISFVIAVFVKWLEVGMSVFVILFFRYLFCLPLLLIYGVATRGKNLFQINNKKILVFRTVSGIIGLSSWFLAITMIDLSLATSLAQLMPIFITILAAIIIGEKVGLKRISAVVFGFLGVMIILGPITMSGLSLGIIFGISSPFFGALMFIFLRMLGRGDAPISTALVYNIAGLVVMAGVIALIGAEYPSFDDPPSVWGMLILVGVLASFQQFMMASSHTFAPASVLAPVHYSAIPLGLFAGIVFFDEQISSSLLIGTGLIIAANYYILVRERARQ